MNDNINSPNHYKLEINGVQLEVIDIIKQVTNDYMGLNAYCMGNVLKYLFRAKKKNGLEDLKKANKYLMWLIANEVNE